jgi:hypothetical protein
VGTAHGREPHSAMARPRQRVEARGLLAPVCDRSTEGFDTPDPGAANGAARRAVRTVMKDLVAPIAAK